MERLNPDTEIRKNENTKNENIKTDDELGLLIAT
jgi:hypothetical protein